jgi:uncharacterized DUF497 family protein
MNDDQFEWDAKKADENYAKHGVNFETAKDVFRDPFAMELVDDREDYGEERFISIGMAEGIVIFVAYTMKADRYRLISARRATKHEHDAYFQQEA